MVMAHSSARSHPHANHPQAQDTALSHTNFNPDDQQASEHSYSIETSPNICLISIRFGDGVEIFVNGDCTVVNFLHYAVERMNQNGLTINPEEYALLDLVDEEGTVQGIRKLPPQEQVSNCLHHRMLYIPVKLEHRQGSTTTTTAPAKDTEDEDWQILLVSHDAYFNYIEEAMLSIKEAKHTEQLPMSAKSPHGDTASIKSHVSPNTHHPPKSPGKKGKK